MSPRPGSVFSPVVFEGSEATNMTAHFGSTAMLACRIRNNQDDNPVRPEQCTTQGEYSNEQVVVFNPFTQNYIESRKPNYLFYFTDPCCFYGCLGTGEDQIYVTVHCRKIFQLKRGENGNLITGHYRANY